MIKMNFWKIIIRNTKYKSPLFFKQAIKAGRLIAENEITHKELMGEVGKHIK